MPYLIIEYDKLMIKEKQIKNFIYAMYLFEEIWIIDIITYTKYLFLKMII